LRSLLSEEIPLYRTKSGAVRLQVVLTAAEYRALERLARQSGCSVSLIARTHLAQSLGWPSGVPLVVEGGKYQPRGFARRKGA